MFEGGKIVVIQTFDLYINIEGVVWQNYAFAGQFEAPLKC